MCILREKWEGTWTPPCHLSVPDQVEFFAAATWSAQYFYLGAKIGNPSQPLPGLTIICQPSISTVDIYLPYLKTKKGHKLRVEIYSMIQTNQIGQICQ